MEANVLEILHLILDFKNHPNNICSTAFTSPVNCVILIVATMILLFESHITAPNPVIPFS